MAPTPFAEAGRPTLTPEYPTDAERLQYERLIASVPERNRLGATAAHGTVRDTCERFALDRGRQLLRDARGDTLPARAAAEKKSPGAAPRGRRPAP